MRMLTGMDIRINLFIFALFAASIACNTPEPLDAARDAADEAINEKCYVVSRSAYEVAAAKIGQVPETPKYPESAVYEVCWPENDENIPSRVRMSEGYRPEEDEIDESEDENSPSGTYVGTSNYPEVLASIFHPGQYTKNTINIQIADDGTVSGSYSIYYIEETYTTIWQDEECTGHWEVDVRGTFLGQLTSNAGTIESKESWVCTNFTNCNIEDACSTKEPFQRGFTIDISGREMTGTTLPLSDVEDGFTWTFEAVKE